MAKRESSSASTISSSVTENSKRIKIAPKMSKISNSSNCKFVGEPIHADKAKEAWPHRYQNGKSVENAPEPKDQTGETFQAKKHYNRADVDGIIFEVGDNAYVEAAEGEDSYICRIVEFFVGKDDGSLYFTAQWYYRAKDTVIKEHNGWIDRKRIFLSEVKDVNPLDCLLKKLKIVQLPLDVDEHRKSVARTNCDYYYDMMYLVEFSSFVAILGTEASNKKGKQLDSPVSNDNDSAKVKPTMALLDLYAGCGGMSTGLCMGANLAGVDLVTKWAVDFNEDACKSLQLNHPETKVRFEMAEHFLTLMKKWENLYKSYLLLGDEQTNDEEEDDIDDDGGDLEDGVFEVDKIMDVRYVPPKKKTYSGMEFQVSWKGYGQDSDSWEPLEDLTGCAAKVKEFVISAYKSKLIPLHGDVDVICGGPPCQGISGLNRHRNSNEPLEDPKNKQMIVYLDIIEFLKPRFVLMENVVDILKFAKGYLARYGLGRLIGLNYQARIGMMAAGAFGLPQYRMRMFMWAALPSEILPPYPLPTHHAVQRGSTPTEFELNVVAYEEGNDSADLQKVLLLEDAISDLPPVENDESRDEMTYTNAPKTEFQKFIRLKKTAGNEALGSEELLQVLYDHIPYKLNKEDFQRTILIPKCKGANFRDLPGVIVGENNKVMLDPAKPRRMLPSGNPLVPNYALTYRKGTSLKPFGRIWWDEVVPTVVTRPQPHNHILLHPNQDRVLTIRENARLQGFPDHYKLIGSVKERYVQVGNAVATPVAKALGYSLGITSKRLCGNGPLLTLPKNFPRILKQSDDQEV